MPDDPRIRIYSRSDNLHYQESDLRYLRKEGEDAWIERRVCTRWERLQDA